MKKCSIITFSNHVDVPTKKISFLFTQPKQPVNGQVISTIVRLEKGQQKPNFSTAKRLSAALDVRPEELAGMSFDAPENMKGSASGAEPGEAAAAIRGRWKKKPDERGMVDAFLADRKEKALRETEETQQ